MLEDEFERSSAYLMLEGMTQGLLSVLPVLLGIFFIVFAMPTAVRTFRLMIDVAPVAPKPKAPKAVKAPKVVVHVPAFEPIQSEHGRVTIIDEFTGRNARGRAIRAWAGELYDPKANMVLVHTPEKSVYVAQFASMEMHDQALEMQDRGDSSRDLARIEEFHR